MDNSTFALVISVLGLLLNYMNSSRQIKNNDETNKAALAASIASVNQRMSLAALEIEHLKERTENVSELVSFMKVTQEKFENIMGAIKEIKSKLDDLPPRK